ncbi:hypothetical protein TNCV_1998951 [Trichonephila clavipes]|nr:hypothetical protein TNCV_1998951 [Trichonephila clavipes]
MCVGCRCHRSACTKTRPDSRVVPRRKKLDSDDGKVMNTLRRAAAVVCRCHRSACTKTRPDECDGKKVTNTHRRAGAVGCRCHRSACTKTRPDSRVVPRRKKSDEYPPLSGCGRMSLSSFRVQRRDRTSEVMLRRKKGDENPPPSGCRRMSLSSFRVH